MNGLSFHRRNAVSESAPERMDIACFIGMISARAGRSLTPEIAAWLVAHSWVTEPDISLKPGKPLEAQVALEPASTFKNVPIPIESWAVFDRLFQWESRTRDGLGGPTYLGIAVRSFFSQGGQKCYVVAIWDSLPLMPAGSQQKPPSNDGTTPTLEMYLPDGLSEQDRTTWKGAGVLFGLEDVSLLVLPDLPELVAQVNQPPASVPRSVLSLTPAPEEHFVRCDETPVPPALPDVSLASVSAPRCTVEGYRQRWSPFLRKFVQAFSGTRVAREVQLVVAMPLPADATVFGNASDLMSLLSLLPDDDRFCSGDGLGGGYGLIQICYPWLKTEQSLDLPEGLQPPDGLMAGLLARNALLRGTFMDATKVVPNQIVEVHPELGRENYMVPEAPAIPIAGAAPRDWTLIQRLSLFGPTPAGLRLLSDVTASICASYRSAPTRRLLLALARTARHTGERLMFGPSGPKLWGRVQKAIETALLSYWRAGALDGSNSSQAFSVRCDRSTMSQNDLDNGRVIVQISLSTAVSIEQIRISLVLSAGDVNVPSNAADSAVEVA